MSMPQAILLCAENGCIVLVDLPLSITQAQASSRCLLSVTALAKPFITPEPKGLKREQFLALKSSEQREYDGQIQVLTKQSLQYIRDVWLSTDWCLPRQLVGVGSSIDTVAVPLTVSCGIVQSAGREEDFTSHASPPLILSSQTTVTSLSHLKQTVLCNSYNTTSRLEIITAGTFYIPPASNFLCTSIREGQKPFDDALIVLYPAKSRALFDLILLDPPWANRSVRHSRAYSSSERQSSDPFEQVLPIVGTYLSETGFVAIWITNKTKVRQQVLQAFGALDLNLQEEWVWLKVTITGDPVMPLDGLWRKPYEFLLLFSKQPSPTHITRRVIVSVPDVHSRKPSLKVLFERFLPAQYHALELFARSLTATWWSWGDEVLKFQHESCWSGDLG